MKQTRAIRPEAVTTGDSEAAAPSSPSEHISKQDMAAYMADMIAELRSLAKKFDFETLGRVLEIAEREARYRMDERG